MHDPTVWKEILLPLDLEIERSLRHIRRLYSKDQRTMSSTSGNTEGGEGIPENYEVPVPLFGDFGNPGEYDSPGGILLPTTPTNFTIQPQFTQMVKSDAFGGSANECPLEHLDKFYENCEALSTNQVSQEYIRMHLFCASLRDRAKKWLKYLPPSSLTIREEVRMTFLRKFYSAAKTKEMRRKISNFDQERDETIAEAWERFNSLTDACPHHGYGKNMWLQIFCDGLDSSSRKDLEAAAGGKLGKVPQDRVEATIIDIVKSGAWGGQKRGST